MIRGYMPRTTSQFQEFARIGAAARIKELQAEIASIRRDFPALSAPGGKRHGRPPSNLAAKLPAPRKRRRKMSAAARKKISEAQKKRWAAQKAKE
jgi:hypothetical protein